MKGGYFEKSRRNPRIFIPLHRFKNFEADTDEQNVTFYFAKIHG